MQFFLVSSHATAQNNRYTLTSKEKLKADFTLVAEHIERSDKLLAGRQEKLRLVHTERGAREVLDDVEEIRVLAG